MSAPFVHGIRTSGAPIRLAAADGEALHLRVEVPEVWDTVQVEAPPTEPVRSVKVHALARLYPDEGVAEDYVMKLRGIEILDEDLSLADAGALDGSIFLLTNRRRRPVR